jgi:hypothetical protein
LIANASRDQAADIDNRYFGRQAGAASSSKPAGIRDGASVMTKPELISTVMGTRVTAHALHVGDRINTIGFEGEALSAVPLAIRVGKTGIAVLFRYAWRS